MRSLKVVAVSGSLALLFVIPLAAKQCLIQDDTAKALRGGGLTSGSSPNEKIWVARYPLQAGGSVSIENVQGNITVEAWDRAEAEVAVVKRARGRNAHPDDVHVEVKANGQRLALRTIYPGESADPVRVEYRLRVPRQVRLERLRTVEGSIRVRDTEGSVDARTLNGSIESLNVTGGVTARAINGDIATSLRALPDGSAPVHMETVNGHLLLTLPAEANADLQMSTVAGRVDSPYALTVSDDPDDSSMRAHLGRGGTQIRLRTVRGDIHVGENDELL